MGQTEAQKFPVSDEGKEDETITLWVCGGGQDSDLPISVGGGDTGKVTPNDGRWREGKEQEHSSCSCVVGGREIRFPTAVGGRGSKSTVLGAGGGGWGRATAGGGRKSQRIVVGGVGGRGRATAGGGGAAGGQ